jgi:DinB superfamily
MTKEEIHDLINQYKAGYDEVIDSLKNFPPEAMTAHPIPGKWSAREIVHHLADSETASAIRLRRLLSEDHPVIQGYDQDEYARRLEYNERDTGPAFEAFRSARATTAQILERLKDDDWKIEGTHTESGRYTVEDWLRIYAAHGHNHAQQIRALRSALNS